MAERKAFNFYNSYWEQIKLLNDKQKLEIFNAICKVQFLEVNIDDISFNNNILNIVWAGIKHSIDTSLKGFLSKQKALGNNIKAPLTKGGIEAPCQQVQAQVQGKEQVQYINYDFLIFWDLYDKKIGDKIKIEKKWIKLKDQEREDILKHIPLYKKSTPEKKYRKNPESFLNNKSWNDELINETPISNNSSNFIKRPNDSDY